MSIRSTPARSRERKAVAGAFVGTAIEWYDFFLFGTAAALVFGDVFYPSGTPGAGVLAAFATFWVGFLTRPIGGALFGHIGDRYGRRNALVITLVLMGFATTLIGLLPGYAQIGVAAPCLLVLLRAAQGIAVGGEWGGAVTVATESARGGRSGRAGMWVQQGSPAGSILSTLAFLAVGTLPDEQFMAWGWRLPFLLSAVLVVVALVVRLQVEETARRDPDDTGTARTQLPLAETVRTAWPTVLLGVGATTIGIAGVYFKNTFTLSWATTELGVGRQTMLNIILAMAVLQFVWQPAASRLADRVGRDRVMAWALVANIGTAVPMFMLISTGETALVALGLALSTLAGSAYYALLAGFLAAAFPPRIRYTGVSLAYQLCSTLIGGATPLIAQFLLVSAGGSFWAVVGFYVAMLALTLASMAALAARMRRATPHPMTEDAPC